MHSERSFEAAQGLVRNVRRSCRKPLRCGEGGSCAVPGRWSSPFGPVAALELLLSRRDNRLESSSATKHVRRPRRSAGLRHRSSSLRRSACWSARLRRQVMASMTAWPTSPSRMR